MRISRTIGKTDPVKTRVAEVDAQLRSLNVESLRCFDAVAGALSFSTAAHTLYLSPSALSQRIRQLEALLGEALFERTTRRVQLTARGQALLEPCQNVLKAVTQVFASADLPMQHELTIGTRYELGLSWLTPALEPLARANPARSLHLCFGDWQSQIVQVARGEIDCLVTSARVATQHMESAVLHQEQYAMVAAPGIVRRWPCKKWQDLAQHRLLDIDSSQPLFRYASEHGDRTEPLKFAGVEQLGTIGAIKLRALAGAGITVLPLYFVKPELRRKTLVRLLPAREIAHDYFRLIWRRNHPQQHAIQALARELRALPLQ